MSLFEYSKWDGSQNFAPQSAEAAFEQLSEYLLQYGDQVLRNLDDWDQDETSELLDLIQKEGLIEKDEDGKYRVTPKGIRRIQDSALTNLFQTFRTDGIGRHETARKGEGSVRHEDLKPYTFGDSLANLDVHETLKNALIRQGGGSPIKVRQDDFVVYETEYSTRCATVVLIDMSGSMARYGKYATTKKVAMALQGMVRGQYPGDTLQLVGFYSYANILTERELLNSAPKPVSLFDSRVNLRFDLDNLPKRVPQHFTNIDAGLKLARNIFDSLGREQQADHRHHRRRADGAHRRPRTPVDLSAFGEDRACDLERSEEVRFRRHSDFEFCPRRRLFLPRTGELRRGDGPRFQRRRRLLLGG